MCLWFCFKKPCFREEYQIVESLRDKLHIYNRLNYNRNLKKNIFRDIEGTKINCNSIYIFINKKINECSSIDELIDVYKNFISKKYHN